MNEQRYKSPLVQVINNELLPKVTGAIQGGSDMTSKMLAMIWKSLEPEIPSWLEILDKDKEAQTKIISMLRGFLATVEENDDTT